MTRQGTRPTVHSSRRRVMPETVNEQVVLEEVDLSRHGTVAVVVRSVSGLEYRRRILLVSLSDGSEHWLHEAKRPETHPRFSPPGLSLAFIAPGRQGRMGAGRSQVWTTEVSSPQSSRQLTEEVHGVSGFSWSPDGTRIAHWGPRGRARFIVGPQAKRSPTARRIRTGGWRWDEAGHVDYWTHLSVTAINDEKAVPVTGGDYDVIAPEWDADGKSIVFTAAMHSLADLYPRPAVYRVSIHGSRGVQSPTKVAELPGLVETSTPSPDGKWMALIGTDVEGAPDFAQPRLFLTRSAGGHSIRLAAEVDLPITGWWIDSDLHGWATPTRHGPYWVDDGDGPAVVAVVSDRGRSHPWRFPYDADTGEPRSEPKPITLGDTTVWQMAVSNGRIVVVGTDRGRAMELMEVRGRTYHVLTTRGGKWQGKYEQPKMTNLEVPGRGGPIEVWLAERADDRTSRPLVIDIHGGPRGAWSPAPSLEVQMLVSAGYRVALPNIRGSATYGSDWIRAQPLWGTTDAEDVLSVLDFLIGLGIVDARRVGLIGLSYGGFLVNWLIGAAPNRWAAAVSENGVSNQVSSWAGSDGGPDYRRRADLGESLNAEGVARLWEQSPLGLVDQITTPLLILQGADDRRTPPSDSEQLFLALRALGRSVEYVLYPESFHNYAVNGRPDRRIDRNRRMLEWFADHLDKDDLAKRALG